GKNRRSIPASGSFSAWSAYIDFFCESWEILSMARMIRQPLKIGVQRRYLPDDDQGRRRVVGACGGREIIVYRIGRDTLHRGSGLLDHGYPFVFGDLMTYQLADQGIERFGRHIEHQRVRRLRELLPIAFIDRIRPVTRQKTDSGGMFSCRQRDARIGGSAEGRGDARYQLVRDLMPY